MAELMKTKELAAYLKLHEITVLKYAAKGVIPAIRIGKVWRFDKQAIDEWISGLQKEALDVGKSMTKVTPKKTAKRRIPKKQKGQRK